MLVIKFVPTFSDYSVLFSAEDVAWQFRGEVCDGKVVINIGDLIVKSEDSVHNYQIIKHLMLQLLLFGVGVEGCPEIDNNFNGFVIGDPDWEVLTSQLEDTYYWTALGLVNYSVYSKYTRMKLNVLQVQRLHEKNITK
jgi:hypothetical protein